MGTYGLEETRAERRDEARAADAAAVQPAAGRTAESVIPLPGEATTAPTTNPDAAYTPQIGGAPGRSF